MFIVQFNNIYIIAVQMNYNTLTRDHGFPIRVVVPGELETLFFFPRIVNVYNIISC
jgi:hypothetical protein